MINEEIIRNYEVSIWTLQDSFITVLKPSGLEYKGNIQEPKITLKDDGENTFTFKVPMYIMNEETGQLEENPAWFTARNGNLIANLRKIKVIFNKQEDDEQVFEFIITKVTETHDGKTQYCDVECGSLAFHELGKQGYTIELSANEFIADWEDWDEDSESEEEEPSAIIDYWIEKVLENTDWDYIICMDWSAKDGIIMSNNEYLNLSDEDRDILNNARENAGLWRKDTIYEDSYPVSWKEENNNLVPDTVVEKEEKKRTPEGKESNRYNLLQTIAETFQVFCKFIYTYDDNYHITGKKVIFYNNFLNESNGVIDFTYNYNVKHISREMDSDDTISKMYVKSLSDTGTFNGEIYLSDSSANKSLENYLLNFDYLYNIGTISQEQYDAIESYYKKIRQLNISINNLNKTISYCNLKLPLLEARIKTAEDLIKEAQSRIANARAELDSISNGNNGVCQRTNKNPAMLTVLSGTDSNKNTFYYCHRLEKGIIMNNNFTLYTGYDTLKSVVSGPINSNNWYVSTTDNIIDKIYFTTAQSPAGNNYVIYATYDFIPSVPALQVQQCYQSIQEKKTTEIDQLKTQIDNLKTEFDNASDELETKLEEKKEVISEFEQLMGPALREGFWQPEDTYSKQKEIKNYTVSNLSSEGSMTGDTEAYFGWDASRFDEDTEFYYYGINMDKKYYPCIDLRNILSNLTDIDLDNLFFVYQDPHRANIANVTYNGETYLQDCKYLMSGSQTGFKFGFLRQKNTNIVFPVIMILAAESMVPYTIKENNIDITYSVYTQLQHNARLSILTGFDKEKQLVEEEIIINNNTLRWISENDLSNYELVYPRFCVDNEKVITTFPDSLVKRNGVQLEANKDYYTNFKEGKYYITLKNNDLIKYYTQSHTLTYAISTAADAIYLDALQIMKENSQPKVSYTVEPLAINKQFMRNAYNRIGQLAHINDVELKFKDVMGYISEVNLILDKPWEDSYTIKNYKTKFEDLFSSIVAQTAAMQRNSTVIGMAANLFNSNGNINAKKLDESLEYCELESVEENISRARRTGASVDLGYSNQNSMIIDKIINGQLGLNFSSGDAIDKMILNNKIGFLIAGRLNDIPTWFQVTNSQMGFFHLDNNNNSVPDLYFSEGNLTLSGHIQARGGTIGGWEIDSDSIFTGTKTANSSIRLSSADFTRTINNNSLTNLRLAFGQNFGLTANGTLYATGANISGTINASSGHIGGTYSNGLWSSGGWYIGSNYIGNQSTLGTSTIGMQSTTTSDTTKVFWAGGAYTNGTPNFYVDSKGKLTATGADITGAIKATSGFIGTNSTNGWVIDSNTIRHGAVASTESGAIALSASSFTRSINQVSRSNLQLAIGNNFGVTQNGSLYAYNATISGTITATAGEIGGCRIEDGNLQVDSAHITSINAGNITSGTLNSIEITAGNGRFHVNTSGYMYASGATIEGNTVIGGEVQLNPTKPINFQGNIISLGKAIPSSSIPENWGIRIATAEEGSEPKYHQGLVIDLSDITDPRAALQIGPQVLEASINGINISTHTASGAGELCLDSGYVYIRSNAANFNFWRLNVMGGTPSTHWLNGGDYEDIIAGTVYISSNSTTPNGLSKAYIYYRNA